jgi:hypothetical protein
VVWHGTLDLGDNQRSEVQTSVGSSDTGVTLLRETEERNKMLVTGCCDKYSLGEATSSKGDMTEAFDMPRIMS